MSRWVALESNPDVLNKYVETLGLRGDFEFVDVFGTDPELLEFVPKPVIAVVLLFPITQRSEAAERAIIDSLADNGREALDKVWFTRQTIENACGTIGVIHSIANNRARLQFEPDSWLVKFFEKAANMTPEERAVALEGEEKLEEAHEVSAQEGQTQAPSREQDVNLHFVALVNVDGHLYELDGRKPYPIDHGVTSEDTLLQDAVAVFQKFVERDPDQTEFSMVALAKKPADDAE